jgi:hypothetical protein
MPKLFVVPKREAEKSSEPEETESELYVSGDTAADLETALMAFAFLIDWVESIGGAEGIRICSETVREFRRESR